MFGRIRHLIPATCGFFGVAAVVWAGSPYLPCVGPVPLRFGAPPAPATNWGSLPPPSAHVAPASASNADLPDDQAGTPGTSEALTPAPLATTNPSEPFVAEAVSPAWPAPPAEPVISPAMLVKYFLPTTNATNTAAPGAVGPVGFTPPSGPPPAAPAAAPAKTTK